VLLTANFEAALCTKSLFDYPVWGPLTALKAPQNAHKCL